MKSHTLKLDNEKITLIYKIIKTNYFTTVETELISVGSYDTLLVFSTLKPFYLKLLPAKEIRLSKPKGFKLSVPELIALYQLLTQNLANIEFTDRQNQLLRSIYYDIYEKGLLPDFYLLTEAQYQAKEHLASLVSAGKIKASQMSYYLKRFDKLPIELQGKEQEGLQQNYTNDTSA